MKQPSQDWTEQVAPDEEKRFALQAEMIRAAHAAKNARYGKGRLLHRKPLLAATARLEVHDNLPEAARHGLFAAAKSYSALVRLSNGALDIQANGKPDIRGFAVKVLGLDGPSSLGGTTDHQDFLLINHASFASRTSDEFVELVHVLATKGELGMVWFLLRKYGLGQALARLKLLGAVLGKPFAGYNADVFTTALPVAIGPYAAIVSLTPLAPKAKEVKDIEADIVGQLARGPIAYQLALQFFTDETDTPIEDPTKVWPLAVSPRIPVATLTLLSAGADVEGLRFDPWGGLMEHRPLGEIMRARKNAYYLSQQARA